MALLAMCGQYKEIEVVAAHVNYHHRLTADRDQLIVEDFCKKHAIKLYIADYQESKGNFQQAAREFRYRFFKEVAAKEGLAAVLVAHQSDDLLETYLMQKKKGMGVSYFGLRAECELFGISVVRPLLKYSKEELLNYCHTNDIPYGIDESNLTDDYQRNYIRHHELVQLSREAREHLLVEIKEKNEEQVAALKRVKAFIAEHQPLKVADVLAFDDPEAVIRELLYYDMATTHIKELLRQLKKTDVLLFDYRDKTIASEGGCLSVEARFKDYCCLLEDFSYYSHKYFTISKSGRSTEGVTVKASDFPLKIRNYRPGDRIKMRFGHKAVAQFFKDRHISLLKRRSYPVVVNRDDHLILVPGLGCDVDHYSTHHNMFVII